MEMSDSNSLVLLQAPTVVVSIRNTRQNTETVISFCIRCSKIIPDETNLSHYSDKNVGRAITRARYYQSFTKPITNSFGELLLELTAGVLLF